MPSRFLSSSIKYASMNNSDGLALLLRHRWKVAAIVALSAIVVLVGYIAAPLADGIMLGIVLAYVGRPLKKWMLKKPFISRFASVLTTMLVVLPVVALVILGFAEIARWVLSFIAHYQDVGVYVSNALAQLSLPEWAYLELVGWYQGLITTPLKSLVPLLQSIPIAGYAWEIGMMVLNMVLSIVVGYFLLADGDRLTSSFMGVVPVEYVAVLERYLTRLDSILKGIFMGTVYTAIIVSLLSIVVFAYFHIPSVLAFSLLVFIAALIPIFSGVMIVGPLAIYRYIEFGLTDAAIFFVVSVLCIYVPAELVIRPYIVSSETKIHPLLLLIAFIGGGLAGGIAGFFFAPILVGALVAAYELHTERPRELSDEA